MVMVVWLALLLFEVIVGEVIEVNGEVIEVKVLFVISIVGQSVVVAVANAPTFGKSFMLIKSSYKL